jgi:hypothetical protein
MSVKANVTVPLGTGREFTGTDSGVALTTTASTNPGTGTPFRLPPHTLTDARQSKFQEFLGEAFRGLKNRR